MKDGQQSVVGVDRGAAIPGLTAEVWERMRQATVDKDTGEVTFAGGKRLYAGPVTGGAPRWSLEEPSQVPEGFFGPFTLSRDAWAQIAGGALVDSRDIIIKGKRAYRLSSVVLEPDQAVKGAARVCVAVVYAPSALGAPPDPPARAVKGDMAAVPTLSRQLWAGMKVGAWHEGGWRTGADPAPRYLHLDGASGRATWVLKPKDPNKVASCFAMSRDDWNRISCGTFVDGKDLVIKDGRALRVMAVKVGDTTAAVTYAPRGLQELPKPPADHCAQAEQKK